jgi:glycine/D-amino acid oxidase-like deaminating enzyme
VRAGATVRAIEAWSAQLSPRSVAPVYSLIVATRPLPASFWEVAGPAGGQTFSDHRHLVVYGQRTADDRLVFGGRGAPYHWCSRIRPSFDRDDRVFAGLRAAARDLFPTLAPDDFTHSWGGPLGIPRDRHAGLGFVRGQAGWAGGYVGDGVATSNLAGRTLAALILGRGGPLTGLPWVGHPSRRWEPEPLRWLLVNAGLRPRRWPTPRSGSPGGRASSRPRWPGRSAAEARVRHVTGPGSRVGRRGASEPDARASPGYRVRHGRTLDHR